MTEEIHRDWNVEVTLNREGWWRQQRGYEERRGVQPLAVTTGATGLVRDAGQNAVPTVIASFARSSRWQLPDVAYMRDRIVDRYREDFRSVPRDAEAVLDARALRFVYVDCGKWGGTSSYAARRTFVVARGRRVALCEFHGSARAGGRIPDLNDSLLNSLLQHIGGGRHSVNVISHTWFSDGPDDMFSGGPAYLFLGDLHLPIETEMPTMGPGGAYVAEPQQPMGRIIARPEDPAAITDREEYNARTAPGWHRSYERGNIFEAAGPELEMFLERLESFSRRRDIHLIQVGDMYELWIGLDRYFEHFRHRSRVALREGEVQGISATTFVEHWVQMTNERNPVALRLQAWQPHSTWIYGNHDNYLAVLHPGIPERQRLFRRHGLYVEHGHQADAYNRDGEIEGHNITQQVFTIPVMRDFDPSRRRHFITFAALRFLMRRDFHIYVMAHTHSPYLATVNVNVRLARIPEQPEEQEEE